MFEIFVSAGFLPDFINWQVACLVCKTALPNILPAIWITFGKRPFAQIQLSESSNKDPTQKDYIQHIIKVFCNDNLSWNTSF